MLTKDQKKNPKLKGRKAKSEPEALEHTHLGSDTPKWGWIEIFLIALLLSPALLFLPGSQSFRPIIRGLPYASSLGMWVLMYSRLQQQKKEEARNNSTTSSSSEESLPRDFRNKKKRSKRQQKGETLTTAESLAQVQKWIQFSVLIILIGWIIHPESLTISGIGYVIFHLSIAAPIFWVGETILNGRHLNRIVWIIFASHFLSAEVGALQIYFPERFMPPEFSSLGSQMNEAFIESLSYIGADGEYIIRPPGLTDLPGGAAISGMFIGFLGVTLATQVGLNPFLRVFCLVAAGSGVFVLYLTQVRSFFIMMLALLAIMCFLLVRLGRWTQAYSIGGIGAGVVVLAFSWAVTVGGDAVRERFMGLMEDSPIETYQENRGGFLLVTLDSLVNYPLGRGVGRWGMVPIYLPPAPGQPRMLHAEIQVTGWAFDGGVVMIAVMWLAIGKLLYFIYRQATQNTNLRMAYLIGIIFCCCALVFGQSFAGPSFSTSVGVQFWFLGGSIFSVILRQEKERLLKTQANTSAEDMEPFQSPTIQRKSSVRKQPLRVIEKEKTEHASKVPVIQMPAPQSQVYKDRFGYSSSDDSRQPEDQES